MDIQFCRRPLGKVRGSRFSDDEEADLNDRLHLQADNQLQALFRERKKIHARVAP